MFKEFAEVAKLEKQNFQYLVEENKFVKVKNNGQIYDSCVGSIARIIGVMGVPMCACVIARIK